VFQQMVNIATFDIIPKDDWYPVWFSLPIDEPLNDRFADLGLGSKFFIMNMGTLFLALAVLQLQTCGYVFVAMCNHGNKRWSHQGSKPCLQRAQEALGEDLLFNSFIRFIYASYIELVFAVALNY
jgi:hypothetical protein